MKVIVVAGHFPTFSETFVINQINGLIERGCDVEILSIFPGDSTSTSILKKHNLSQRCTTLTRHPSKKIDRITYRIKSTLKGIFKLSVWKSLLDLNTPTIPGKSRLFFSTICATHAKNSAPRFVADAIIVHFGNNAVIIDRLIKYGVIQGKLYPVFHGFDISTKIILNDYYEGYKQLFRSSASVLPISELWQKRLIEMGCPEKKINVVRMGIDVDNFSYSPKIQRNKPLSILSVARFTEKKGIEYALKAISILKKRGVDVHYQLIGSGHLLTDYERIIKNEGITSSVHILGYLSGDKIREKLSESDVFMLPSVVAKTGDMEGIPVALMEAMAKGNLCVSTFHSGIPELIEHQKSGFLAPERDAEALADIIEHIVKMDDSELDAMREHAKKRVHTEFNQIHIYDKLKTFLTNETRTAVNN